MAAPSANGKGFYSIRRSRPGMRLCRGTEQKISMIGAAVVNILLSRQVGCAIGLAYLLS